MAGWVIAARRELRRPRRELRALLRARDAGGALPVRFAGRAERSAADHAAGEDRSGLARLSARRAARTNLRLPRPRTSRTARGHRFNPRKVLLDPYAKAIARDALGRCGARSGRDTAFAPLARVVDHAFPGTARSRRARRGTRRSSTNCTSKASPNNIPTCRRIYAALTRASLRPRPSSICASWA